MSTLWVLLIGGHDPSGGAGIQADEETVRAFGVEARTVATAWTDQDERAVRAVGARPAAEWATDARELSRARPAAIKMGLLPDVAAVRAAAELIDAWRVELPDVPVVVDPVLSSSSGFQFLDAPARAALLSELLPSGPILTPNLPEAAELTGLAFSDLCAKQSLRVAAARALLARGASAVVLKGGHAPGDLVRDLVLVPPASILWIEQPRRETQSRKLRGTGCRHASALAAGLARGRNLSGAARDAAFFVGKQIAP